MIILVFIFVLKISSVSEPVRFNLVLYIQKNIPLWEKFFPKTPSFFKVDSIHINLKYKSITTTI